MATLKKGSSGPAVQRVQITLNRLGFGSLTQDGKFGSATESAVRSFQRKNGLDPDGKIGPLTQAVMEPYINQVIGSLTLACVAKLERMTEFEELEVLVYG